MSEPQKNVGVRVVQDGAWLEIVRQKIGSLRFGVVQIVVHESRVVQIEQTERIRLASSSAKVADDAA